MDNLVNVAIFVIFVWLVGLTFFLYKTFHHYQRLIEGTGKKNLAEVLDKILGSLDVDKKNIAGIKTQLDKVTVEITNHIQKIGILRFNPYADTGGEQSFVLAILDGVNTGIVLTSLHSRGITRWYIKNVKEGKGTDYELSDEELKAIKQSVQLKPK